MRTTSRLGIIVTAPVGSGYGERVVTCAHLMGGFSAGHNPGMHHGAAGWDGQTCH